MYKGEDLHRQHIDHLPENVHFIYQFSYYLMPLLKECGYSGSERTLRNYLHTHPSRKEFPLMIKFRNTNNLVGITILGDYDDLSALRDALCNYTELFLSNQDAYDCQQSILGLCQNSAASQGLQSSLGLYPDFQPHRLLHFVPGLIRAVAQPLLGFQKAKQRNPRFPASDVVS